MISIYQVYMSYVVVLCCLATGYLYYTQYRLALRNALVAYGYFFLLVATTVVVMGVVLGAMMLSR